MRIAKYFFYAALFTPIILIAVFFFPFISGKVFLFRTAVTCAIISILFSFIWRGRLPHTRLWRQPLTITVVLFCLLFVVTALTGVVPYQSFWSNFERSEGGFQMLHYLAFFLLAFFLFHSRSEWRQVARIYVGASFLVSLYGFFQWLARFGISTFAIVTGGRTSGTLGNPSYLGAYLIFTIFFTAWLLSQERQRWLKWLWGAYLAFQVFLFFTTETLAAYLGFGAAFLLLIILYLLQLHQQIRTHHSYQKFFVTMCYLASCLIVVTAGGMIYFFSTINLSHRLAPRLWTWGSALSGIAERPLLGWGAEGFSIPFDKYYNPNHFGNESWFDRTHNIFLEYLISGGVILLLAYLAMFAIYYRTVFRLKRDWFWPFFVATPIAYLIQGMTLFDVLPIYLSLFLFFAFTVHASADFEPAATSQINSNILPRSLQIVISVLGIAGLLWLLYFGTYLPLRKNLLISDALRMHSAAEAIGATEAAFQFSSPIGQQETYESIGRNFVLYLQQLIKENKKADQKNPNFLKMMSFNEEFFRLQPRLAGVKDYYLFGIWDMAAFRLSQDQSYLVQAKKILQTALEKSPTRLELLLSLAEVAQIERDGAAQQKYFERIRMLRPDLVVRKVPS